VECPRDEVDGVLSGGGFSGDETGTLVPSRKQSTEHRAQSTESEASSIGSRESRVDLEPSQASHPPTLLSLYAS
jgi:hypothetical protein